MADYGMDADRIMKPMFNKSHAACYALVSYRTAWLKANYPAEYMAALPPGVNESATPEGGEDDVE